MISAIDAYNIAQGTYPEELKYIEDTIRQAALISKLQRGLAQEQIKVDDFMKEKLNEQTQFFGGN